VTVTRVTGSGPALAQGRRKLRSQVIEEGVPVKVGSVGSWHGDTSSCSNPGTDDCTTAVLSAIVKNYLIGVVLANPALPTGLPEPAPGQEDVTQDLAQEETDKAPMVAIAQTVAKAL
jgi:hypothetical protein